MDIKSSSIVTTALVLSTGSTLKKSRLLGAVCALSLCLSTSTNAALIHHYDHSYSSGAVDIALDVFDGQSGGRYLWQYTVTNNSYDPNPGTSNGFSGFELYLPSPIPEIADITAPTPGISATGWVTNCCSGLPLEWDIVNDNGLGVMPGEAGIFSFTTDPRQVAINNEGWFHSWQFGVQTDIIATNGMHVPLVPGLNPVVPVPAAVWLFGSGMLGLIGVARRKACV